MAIPPEQRESLKAIRLSMLELHKLLLDRERGVYEKEHGPIASAGDYLALVLGHAQFDWLRRMSGVIVELDELISIRTKSGPEEAEATLESLRGLLTLDENGNDFQRRYYEAIQDSPDIVIAHCRAQRLLNARSKPTSPPQAASTAPDV
jgi:hypothetical protein